MDNIDKKLRHELKFIINSFEYSILSRKLKHILSKDVYTDENWQYSVRSLYFDDTYNSGLYDKESGIENREKYRIRIYDMKDSIIKLEKKSKLGQYTCKESTMLSRRDAERILAGETYMLRDSKNTLLRNFYCDIIIKLLRPAVIVEYDREVYYHPAGNMRITLDKYLRVGLNSSDLFSIKIPTIGVLENNSIIMEIKYDKFFPVTLRDILGIPMRQKVSISKYAECRRFCDI